MKKILILGGAGFIGSNITKKIIRCPEDYQITIFDACEIDHDFGNSLRYFKGDFNNLHDIDKVLSLTRYDIIIHLISTTIPADSNKKITKDIGQNLIPTVKLLELMVKYQACKIIFFSSGGTVYGESNQKTISENHPTNPISSHGAVKLTIEKYIYLFHKLYGLDYLILRLGNPYGMFQKTDQQGVINVFIRRILANKSLEIRGDGNTIRDYIYIDDVARIVEQLIKLEVKNEILNIGSGVGVSVNEIIELLKSKIPYNNVLKNVNMLDADIHKNVLNIEKLKSIIEFKPTIIKDGIDNLLKLLKNT